MQLPRMTNAPSISPLRAGCLISILAACCLLSGCGGVSVAKVKSESDAIEIMNVLTESGFEVEKEEEGEGEAARWSVIVDGDFLSGDQSARASQVLSYYGLPRKEEEGAAESSLGFPDPAAEQAKQLERLERKVEKQLRTLPGIARVEVSIVLPENDDTKIKPYKASASVSIVRKEVQPSFTLEAVQNQVAGSVPDLQPQNVSVTLSYEQPPVVGRADLNLRRRNRIIFLIGSLLVLVLCGLLITMLFKMRRQRAELAALQREADEEPLEPNDDEATRAEREGEDERDFVAGTAPGTRQLPTGTTGNNPAITP